jgi:hypothetical protein
VEFLEYICRVADKKTNWDTAVGSSLEEKLEAILDILFAIIKKERKDVDIQMEYISESEEECNYDLLLT